MYSLTAPSAHAIDEFLRRQAARPWSYQAVGATRSAPPQGFLILNHRTHLGKGGATFHRAKEAITGLEMLRLPWLSPSISGPAPSEGLTIVLTIRCPIWMLMATRIVYCVEEHDTVERFGFAYGTLAGHPMKGEERFCIEWHREDDSVWYDIFSFSSPDWPPCTSVTCSGGSFWIAHEPWLSRRHDDTDGRAA